MRTSIRSVLTLALCAVPAAEASAQSIDLAVAAKGDSVTIRFGDTDTRAALQAISQYLDRPLVLGLGIPAGRLTFETPRPLPKSELPRVLRGLLDSQGLDLIADTVAGIYRVQVRPTQPIAVSRPPLVPGNRSPGGPIELFILHMKHVRAGDVSATVNALYGRASAVGELGNRARPLSDELRDNIVPPPGPPGPPATGPGPGSARTAAFAGEVIIVADSRSNSLLVRASREDFQLVEAAVHEIDVRPLQVLIEVLIVEVRRNKSVAFGLDITAGPAGLAGGTATASQAGLGLGDFVLKVMGVGGKNLDATLSAAAARGDARVVSRPVVIAANNEEANILVGSQRPFVQVQRSLPTEAAARDQVVQYKDVGTRLVVKPTISDDKYVMLDVMQEVNQATAEAQFDAPIISTRNVKTRLLIRDGQTVVLGGLTDRQRDHSQGGIPLLSSIPWIGGLFGHVSDQITETELFIFIKPHVLRNDADADAVTDPKLKKTGLDP